MTEIGDTRRHIKSCLRLLGGSTVNRSVLDAIKIGMWDFEPEEVTEDRFKSTHAMPGTKEKLDVLAQRVEEGLPLWHSADRTEFEENE